MTRFAMAAALVLSASAVANSAAAAPVEQARDVPAFTKVRLEGGIDADIRVGESRSVVIVTEADQQEDVATEVRGDTLVIDLADRRRFDDPIRAEIAVGSLEGIAISGSSDLAATGIDAERFAVSINGSGDVELIGRCGRARFEINGSGDIAGRELRCTEIAIEISGSGDAELYASGSVTVEISGSGDVELWGGGRIAGASISGSGDLETHSGGR